MLNDGVDFESFVSSFVDDSTSLGLLSTREQHASALSIPEEQKRVVDEDETVQGPREAGKAQKQDFKPSLATIKEDAEGDIAREAHLDSAARASAQTTAEGARVLCVGLIRLSSPQRQ